MINEIGTPENIQTFVDKAKDRNGPFRIMGLGHRIYKNYDPRVRVIRQTCHERLNELGVENDPILQTAHALEDEDFVERELYLDIDFYSGIILRAIGVPAEIFTVISAIGRTPGWVA